MCCCCSRRRSLTAFGVAVMQPALPPLVRAWLPHRIGFGTAVYTNGLLVGEIIPVTLTGLLVLPLIGNSWRLEHRDLGRARRRDRGADRRAGATSRRARERRHAAAMVAELARLADLAPGPDAGQRQRTLFRDQRVHSLLLPRHRPGWRDRPGVDGTQCRTIAGLARAAGRSSATRSGASGHT